MTDRSKRRRVRAALITMVVLVAGAPVTLGATAAAGQVDDSCVHEPTPPPEPATPTPGCVHEPTPGPTVEPTPEPTPEPTAVPTAEPTVEPTPGPTVLPPAEPTPEPTAEPTVLPPAEPTPSGEDEPAGGQLADTGPSGTAGFAVAGVVAVVAGALVLLGSRRPRDL